MRKRFMNLSKRCMVAIMSAAMLMSSVAAPIVFPVGVYANELANNQENNTVDEIASGDTMNNNQGTVTTNNGTVKFNHGTITTNNNGSVKFNVNTVTTNNGTIEENEGTLTTNNGIVIRSHGIVTTNNGNGTVKDNHGTVTTNYGTIEGNYETVTDNFGTVTENQGTVVNNFDGQVTNNDNGTVTNQYWRAELDFNEDDADKVGVTYGNDITTKTVGDINRHYIKDGQSGTITLTPAGGFEINGNTGEELNGTDSETNTAFTYSAGKDANGVWTITILNMPGSLYLNPENLNLMIQAITGEENPKANIVVPSGESSDDDGGSNPPSDETNNNIVTPANPALDRINTALKITPNAKELSVSFVTQTNLTLNDIKTLCETRPDLAKRCSITDKEGNIYELYIPAGVAGMKGYEEALDKLKDQPNSLAGPLTICGIFKDLGFTCTKIANLKDLTVRGSNSSAANAVQPQTAAITNGNAVTAAVRNSVLQISADPLSIGGGAYTVRITSSIADAPFGGTVKIATSDTAFLNDMIVSSLETRNDVSLEMILSYGGTPYLIKIPAAYNLRALLGADGKIDMQKLIEIFGTSR